MKRDDTSPQAYRDDVAGEQRTVMEAIRDTIFEVAPDVRETIEYGMLSYPGLACLAAQKHYVSLYVRPAVLVRHRDAFPGVSCGKSCLRFRRLDSVDADALRALFSDILKA
jgi:uncharacterized protein YdhG (YjbR/CyaY superfamily)